MEDNALMMAFSRAGFNVDHIEIDGTRNDVNTEEDNFPVLKSSYDR